MRPAGLSEEGCEIAVLGPPGGPWSAASALEHGPAVYTRAAHFAAAPGLLVLGVNEG